MPSETIKLPAFPNKFRPEQEVSYADLLGSLTKQIDGMPDFVRALKKADNAGWQRLVDDVAKHAQTDPKLAKFIREREEKGVAAISVGDPNWIIAAGAAAFAFGYALGTLCFKAGPCDFSR